jgi:ornithine decarboxylase
MFSLYNGLFDCSLDLLLQGEIDAVMQLGVSTERIIYANPCKTRSYIDYARRVGVNLMTFDNEPELHKIASIFPSARVVLRIKVDDSHSVCRFSAKFGAHMNDAPHLLQVARALGLQVVGVSFHVGSGCESLDSFVSAIEDARVVFDLGKSLGFNMQLLDLGGGYPGTSDAKIPFEPIAQTIQGALNRLFPPTDGLRIIAEPGRYFAAGSFTLVTQVIAKREMMNSDSEAAEVAQFVREKEVVRCNPQRLHSSNAAAAQAQDDETFANNDIDVNREIMYYLNDGVYGSFNCTIFDHWTVNPVPWLPANRSLQSYTRSVLWGPTCDSMDLIRRDVFLPELDIGDWVVFSEMGAYTIAAASAFNGFKLPNLKYQLSGRIMTELKGTQDWPILKNLLVDRPQPEGQFTAGNEQNRLHPTPPDTEPADRVEACMMNGEISYIRVH